MNVLLSIRPEYASAILAGEKKYEFRKSRIRIRKRNQKAFIYATAPVSKIVGAFTIKSVAEEHPRTLWRKFGRQGGIDEKGFYTYFGSRKRGFAIEIGSLKVFRPPVEPKDFLRNFVPPQSFSYVGGIAAAYPYTRR